MPDVDQANSTPSTQAHKMQCIEVWGGNQETDSGVVMMGLDAWVYSRPYQGEQAGGDIHYVSSCATGRITRVLLADVAGHGAGASELSGKLRSLMRRYVNFVNQARFVAELNREFTRESDAGRFATAVVATFWAPTDEFTLTNAGHPRPFWFRARQGAWSVMGADLQQEVRSRPGAPSDIPLGIDETTYQVRRVRLRQDDLILLYTDALVDAVDGRDPSGRTRLGEAGLLELVSHLDHSSPGTMIQELLEAIGARCNGLPPDDITLMLLRPNALKPRSSFLGGVKATGRMLRETLRTGRWPGTEWRRENIGGAFFEGMNSAAPRD
jgi:serine phosphatase RsbU (regulator of sigma subunit)